MLYHLAKHAGIPAAIGMVIAGILTFPQQNATPTTGAYGVTYYEYHNIVGASGLSLQEGAAECFFAVLIGAVFGFLVGGLLISTGVIKSESTKFPE
jgi:hypothetical protein